MSRISPRLALGAIAAALLLCAAPAGAATPIPGEGTTTLQPFRGAPASPKPIHGIAAIPQSPFMARNPDSNVHDDAWMTDSYTRSGPLGRSPSVFSAVLGNRVCITIAFDTRGRIVASCVSATTGPRLFMLDPRTLDTLAQMQLPYKPPAKGIPPQLNTAGGVYFYLDNRDRAVLATTDRRIWIVEETGGTRRPGFRRVAEYRVARYLKGDERLPSVLPDWQGRLWFVGRQSGTVGVLSPRTGRVRALRLNEEIENSFAVAREGVYIVSDKRMYRMEADRRGVPQIVWRARYDNSGISKPGQIDAGSGTTPTVMQGGYVSITDNADPMQVVVYRRAAKLRRGERRTVCEVPVFAKGASATENSLIAVGRSMIVENNYGYVLGQTAGGKLTAPGMARVDIRPGGRGCRLVWTNRTVRAPSVVPKASLRNGLLYTFTKEADPGAPTADVWSWTALDFRTGRTVWQRLAGVGGGFNNHYAGIALAPDGRTAYLGGVGGVMAIRDGGR